MQIFCSLMFDLFSPAMEDFTIKDLPDDDRYKLAHNFHHPRKFQVYKFLTISKDLDNKLCLLEYLPRRRQASVLISDCPADALRCVREEELNLRYNKVIFNDYLSVKLTFRRVSKAKTVLNTSREIEERYTSSWAFGLREYARLYSGGIQKC